MLLPSGLNCSCGRNAARDALRVFEPVPAASVRYGFEGAISMNEKQTIRQRSGIDRVRDLLCDYKTDSFIMFDRAADEIERLRKVVEAARPWRDFFFGAALLPRAKEELTSALDDYDAALTKDSPDNG